MAIYLQLERLLTIPAYHKLIAETGNSRFVAYYLWLQLLIQAKRINDNGRFSFDKTRPYSLKAIGDLTYITTPRTLKRALNKLYQLGLIRVDHGLIYVTHWDYLTRQAEHQIIPAAPAPQYAKAPFQCDRRFPAPKKPLTPELKQQAHYILTEFGRLLGAPLEPDGKNLSYVLFWLQQGYQPATLISVMEVKYQEWHTSQRMHPFIRPTTIFGPKFPSYQGALPRPPEVHPMPGPSRKSVLSHLCIACNFEIAKILKRAKNENIATTQEEVATLVQSLRV